nr:MAG TPA: hypothetical protein [Caudoviricetes sp.]
MPGVIELDLEKLLKIPDYWLMKLLVIQIH